MTDKIIPHDIDAEEAVLGSCLVDRYAIRQIGHLLNKSDFYSDRNGSVFACMLDLDKRNELVDQITVAQELSRIKSNGDIAGAAFLSHLISITPHSLDVEMYANIVRRLSISRKLINAGDSIKELGYSANSDLADTLNRADNLILDVRKSGVPSPIITPQDRQQILLDRYNTLYNTPEGVAIKTGIRALDYTLGGGFYAGDMIVLGARPGMGKTSLMQTLTSNISSNKIVLFCSGEMSIESLSDRDVAGLTHQTIPQIRRGGYKDELHEAIVGSVLDILKDHKVYFYRDTPLTVEKILQACMAMKMRYGLDVCFIDYLGMLDDEYGRSQYEKVGYISRKIKQLALKMDIPVLIAHQLNRDVQGRDDKRPQLSDLRDSGRVEEDADVVMFMYRDSYYMQGSESNKTELIIAKQRQGESNKTVNLMFDKDSLSYKGLAEEYQGDINE